VVPLQALHEDQQKQIEELTAQLQEAQINKSRLETRCQLLEKVVSIRGGGGDVAGSSVSASPIHFLMLPAMQCAPCRWMCSAI
jgi:hypothetical protein